MKLSIRFLDNYSNANTYQPTDQITFAEGSTVTVYFELIDLSKNCYGDPPGLLYIASSTPTLQLTVNNVANSLVLNKFPALVAGTPFWSMSFAVGEITGGTYSLTLKLTEGSNISTAYTSGSIKVLPSSAFAPGGYYVAGSNGYIG